MSEYLLIAFQGPDRLHKGSVCWSGNYLQDILNASELTAEKISAVKSGIGYFMKKGNTSLETYDLIINQTLLNDKNLTVNYSVAGISPYKSSTVMSVVKRLIQENTNGINNYPYCIKVKADVFNSITDEELLIQKIKIFESKNNWLGIYNLFAPISGLKNKAHIWNNHFLLNRISFACAKLSETYVNLKRQFKSKEEEKNYLSKQKQYREETIMLRKRCIELSPGNAPYYSNLGYSHYQFVRELMLPGGRRDGNLKQEAEKCIETLNKALEIDPCRITDNYRKGKVLTSVLPVQIMFSNNTDKNRDKFELADEKIKEGIKSFKKAEETYELLPLIEDKVPVRYRKEYIKSLYNIAASYGKLVKYDWDLTRYISRINVDCNNGHVIKSEELDAALVYIEKCILQDNPRNDRLKSLKESIDLAKHNGSICGVYKLYSAGKYFFMKYWYLSGHGKLENTEANEARKYAEDYLTAALKYPWTNEFRRQSKAFIAERLARVYISKGEYGKASQMLKEFVNERTDYYIKYTYATALNGSGNKTEARKQLTESLLNKNRNKEIWLGHYFLSCLHASEGNMKEAMKETSAAIDEAKKSGKKNLYVLYVSQAFIQYKLGNKEAALNSLELAMKAEPNNRGIAERYRKWKNGEQCRDLMEF